MKFIYIIITTAFISFVLYGTSKSNDLNSNIENKSRNNWIPPTTPKEAKLFGEKVPLDRFDVYERLDRELLTNNFYHTSSFYIIKLKSRFQDVILSILREERVPEDFFYLCIAESSLQNVKSPAGAEGFWQFLSQTAKSYGLEVNEHIDERYHVEKSTRAACKYLKEAKEKFGTWTAAAASYNCGMGGYNSHSNYQGTNHYYDLHLPEETNRYIYRILALKLILEDPPLYGFNTTNLYRYEPIETKKTNVNHSITDLSTWAKQNGSNYKMVRLLNPWIRGKSLPNKSGKNYVIELPNQ